MNTPMAPKLSRAPTLPLIWVVPLIALAVCSWIGIGELRNRGPGISIDFADGTGIEAGKTVLEYKGVTVGMVSAVTLMPDLSGVSVSLRLNKSAAVFANAGSEFWVIHPEIGFSGVRGLDTLLTGSRLNARPGSGLPIRSFKGLDDPPTAETPPSGRSFYLQCERLGSLTAGAPVFYREFKVGEVEATRLAGDSASVLVRIHVEAPYVDLVRTKTRFWNAGGFNFKLSLFGAQFSDTSLESLIAGGVAFATPDGDELGTPAPDGALFQLSPEPDKAWLRWTPQIPIEAPEVIAKAAELAKVLPTLIKP
jgi:paraquat-inducible protein B